MSGAIVAPAPISTVLLDVEAPHELVHEMRLVPLQEGAAEHHFTTRALLGTASVADLKIADPAVSRLHCEITIDHGRARIRDLGSLNGTYVEGVPVIEAYLPRDATVTVGSTRFRFQVGAEQTRVALSRDDHFGRMVGQSVAMRRIFAQLERVAPTDGTILITGETGTGKEVVADSIHGASRRCDGPFIVVDCGATPAQLLESELFGHERGAFTSATSARTGAFEACDGGTLFLDELGELPLDLQPKLLRAIAERQIKRVGSNTYRPVDIRLIAATNRDLRAEVDRKTFRSDLFYRLAVVEVVLPPLRERTEDIALLVNSILTDLPGDERLKASLRTRDSLARLARHSWPGNVRELRNYLERSVLTGEASHVMSVRLATNGEETTTSSTSSPTSSSQLPEIDANIPYKIARDAWCNAFEREYLIRLLGKHGDNVAAAARGTGVDRGHLYRLLWKHGLR